MKGFIIITVLSFFFNVSLAQSGIDKNSFFNAMASNNTNKIEAQLNELKKESGADKDAFEGAMLMRKAGTLTVPAKKLSTFKRGHKLLEAAIAKSPNNAEYRFLRLMVQENAPRSLGYYKSIDEDSKFIKDNFRTLSAATQNSVADYGKKSKALAGIF
jgi:hypothetical protein